VWTNLRLPLYDSLGQHEPIAWLEAASDEDLAAKLRVFLDGRKEQVTVLPDLDSTALEPRRYYRKGEPGESNYDVEYLEADESDTELVEAGYVYSDTTFVIDSDSSRHHWSFREDWERIRDQFIEYAIGCTHEFSEEELLDA
jgi:hypothetical protein